VWGEVTGGFGGTPLEDPVLSSFSRCLAGDILCVWRRVAATPASSGSAAASASAPGAGIFDLGIAPSPAPPPLSLTAAKELWIFWYGEEPDLSGLVSPELIACGKYGSLARADAQVLKVRNKIHSLKTASESPNVSKSVDLSCSESLLLLFWINLQRG